MLLILAAILAAPPERLPAEWLAARPEVAAKLRLTTPQSDILAVAAPDAPWVSWVYLRPEQSATFATLGVTPTPSAPKIPTRVVGWARFTGVTSAILLTEPVRKDLELTDAQARAVADILHQRQSASEPIRRALSAALPRDKMARIEQIRRQSEAPETVEEWFGVPNELADIVGVTAAQRKRFADLKAARLAEAILLAERPEDMKAAEAFETSDQRRRDELDAILTPEQHCLAAEAMGPYAAVWKASGAELADEIETLLLSMRRDGGPGLSANDPRLLARIPALRKELSLTDTQRRRLLRAAATIEATRCDSSAARVEEERAAERALRDVLSRGQLARYRELCVQHAEKLVEVRTEFIIGEMPRRKWSHPLDVFGVPAALGLTPTQVRRYREGESPDDVLDAKQKATLATLGGKKADVVEMFLESPLGVSSFDAEPAIAEVAAAGLLPHLKLRPDQAATLADALNAYHADRPLTDAPSAGMKALTESAVKLLDEAQKRRLAQLRVQAAAARDPVFALRAWAESLSLTDAQTRVWEIASASSHGGEAVQEIFEG